MDKFIEKISGLSYELVSILIPGFSALICMVLCVSIWQYLLQDMGIDSTLMKDFISIKYHEGQVISWMIFAFSIYVLGQCFTSFSKKSFEAKLKKDQICRSTFYQFISDCIWFPDDRNKPVSYWDYIDLSNVANALKEVGFDVDAQSPEWNKIFGPASRYIWLSGSKSLIQTYQNKYTLHRTLGVQFAIVAKVLFFMLMASFIQSANVGTFSFKKHLIVAIIIVICWLVQEHFVTSFRRFWTEFGTQICNELLSLRAIKKGQMYDK